MKTIIISAYTCCGKTYLYEHWKDKCNILDSDSSKFHFEKRKRTEEELQAKKERWDAEGHLMSGESHINHIKNDLITVINPEYPNNYIRHIKDNLGVADIILVPSYLPIRQAMDDARITYVTVYPNTLCMNEYIGRMVSRGDKESAIQFQYDYWHKFLYNISSEPHGKEIIWLKQNQYLSDVIYDIIGKFYYKYNMED